MPSISYTRVNSFRLSSRNHCHNSTSSGSPFSSLVKISRRFLVQAGIVFHFYMEFGIVGQQGFNGLVNNVFFISPSSVSTDHLTELGSIVAQVVDPYRIIAQEIVDFVDGISDYGASEYGRCGTAWRCWEKNTPQ